MLGLEWLTKPFQVRLTFLEACGKFGPADHRVVQGGGVRSADYIPSWSQVLRSIPQSSFHHISIYFASTHFFKMISKDIDQYQSHQARLCASFFQKTPKTTPDDCRLYLSIRTLDWQTSGTPGYSDRGNSNSKTAFRVGKKVNIRERATSLDRFVKGLH